MSIKRNKFQKIIIIGALYFLVIVFFTWPLIFHLKTQIYGYPGDAFAMIHRIWYEKVNITEANPPLRAEGQLVLETLASGFGKVFNEVVAYNLIVLVAFFLSLINAHVLISSIFKRNDIAIPLAIAYGVSQFNLWQGMQHIEFVLASGFLPFLLLSLIKLEETEKIDLKRAFFVAVSFSLCFFSSFYIGFFAILFMIAFFFLSRIFHGKAKIGNYFLSGLFLTALTLLATLPVAKSLLYKNDQSVTASLVKDISSSRKTEELVAYGARPWDYLAPSINHPIFGKVVIGFYSYLRQHLSYQFKSVYLPERSNFIPLTIILFALYGAIVGIKDRSKRFLSLLSFLLGLFMFWVSLPGKIHIPVFDINFYSPSWLIFKVVPFFRVYARAGILVLLCLLVLAAFGINKFLSKKVPEKARFWLILISLLVVFENLNFPPFPVTNLPNTSKIYEWVKSQPKNSIIVEYPKDNSKNDIGGGCEKQLDPKVRRDFSYDLIFQITHEKKVVLNQDFSAEDRVIIGDLGDKKTYKILKGKGVNYIVYHTTDLFPKNNPLDECQSRRYGEVPSKTYDKIKLVESFNDGVIYQIM